MIVITIDGPTASGKSTIAQLLAQRLGFYYINSGLLFRAIAYSALYKKSYRLTELPILTHAQLDESIKAIDYCYDAHHGKATIVMQGVMVTDKLKTPEIAQAASILATNSDARHMVLTMQQSIAKKHKSVVEGRDAGSVVFPQAQHKFFLTATLEERIKRWQNYQKKVGTEISWQQAHDEIIQRDERDTTRLQAPLVVPHDALVIDTTHLSIEQTITKLLHLINSSSLQKRVTEA